MAIVLEGPDNSGKSTLAQRLYDATGWPIIHAGGPPKTADEVRERLIKDFSLMQQKVIMDRSFILSDMIYAPILRGSASFDPRPHIRMVQQLDLHCRDFCLVFCDAPDNTLFDYTHHIVKPHETEMHVAKMKKNAKQLADSYRTMHMWFSLFMDCMQINPRSDIETQGLVRHITATIVEN
jgi:sigma54-dependent transcription regulator